MISPFHPFSDLSSGPACHPHSFGSFLYTFFFGSIRYFFSFPIPFLVSVYSLNDKVPRPEEKYHLRHAVPFSSRIVPVTFPFFFPPFFLRERKTSCWSWVISDALQRSRPYCHPHKFPAPGCLGCPRLSRSVATSSSLSFHIGDF